MKIKIAIGLLMALAVLAGPAPAQEMTVITEASPPFNFIRKGTIIGSSTEVVREILRRLGQPDNIRVLPWARGYKLLQSRPAVALFSTTRTPEREDQFYWVGPLFTVHFGFYAKKGSGLQLNSLEDAKKVGAIATYKDDVKEQLLKSKGFTNLDSSKSPASNLKKLMSGRVDLWLFDNLGMPGVARQQNVDPTELELVLPFRSYQSYVAISRQTPEEVVGRWQSALQAMVEDGTFFDISRRWLPAESIPDFRTKGQYAAGAPVLKIYTEDSPPGSYVMDGQPAGFAVEIVRVILQRLKQPDTIAVVPWSRGFTLAQNSPNVALFSTTRLAQREKRFYWVGPLYHQTWAFFSRKGAGIRIHSLGEAKKINRIGTYLRDAKEQYLQRKGFTNLVSANHNISNVRHLIDGNIDLWVSSDFNMPYLVRQAGFDPDKLERVYAFRQVSNYIAFSLGTPLTVVRDWQQCLDGIRKDGTYLRIAHKYNIQSPPQ
ncbi:MAG: ABC transporter substrate-binding protein [Desulfosarcina sp.]|nr:ABC transporter substrate-binding protein [Desulfobacterales bacterium]